MRKELSYRGMSTSTLIEKLRDLVDSADYCEIEGYLCRAIFLLEQYRDEYDFIHRDDD